MDQPGNHILLRGNQPAAAERPPQWAESLAEHIEVLRAQVAPVAELHSLWADLGTVSENVEHALPQLQAVCDTVGQTGWESTAAGSPRSTASSARSRAASARWTASSARWRRPC